MSRPVFEVISRLVGGAAVNVISVSAALDRRGTPAVIVHGLAAEDEGVVDALARREGAKTIRVESLRRGISPWDLAATVANRRLIGRLRPPVVHTHGAKGGATARIAALTARPRPVIVHTFHGHVLTGYFSPFASKVFALFERMLGKATDAIVVPAEAVKRELVALGVAPASKFRVIPYGLDLTAFEPAEGPNDPTRLRIRRQLGIPPSARVVTLVSRLAPVKRPDRFLRAAASLDAADDVRFVVVGTGELAAELESSDSARSLGGRLVWAGHRDDMAAIYRASDVLAVTSDHEGAPISIIEAQATGLPVVATDVGGVAEVVQDGRTGITVSRESEDLLAQSMLTLIRDPELASQLGAAGRQRALSHFTVQRQADETAALYEELRAARRTGRD